MVSVTGSIMVSTTGSVMVSVTGGHSCQIFGIPRCAATSRNCTVFANLSVAASRFWANGDGCVVVYIIAAGLCANIVL